MNFLAAKIRLYKPLIKTSQTSLLLATGVAGYLSAGIQVDLVTLLGLTLSLFLSISGSTILNMYYDRDIDTVMNRTHNRPLAAGTVSPREALRLGLVFSLLGVGLAMAMDPLYGLVVFAGLFFDVVVYTIWLKRKTCWSIVWGGISGGMPILAGRVLAVGHVDLVGILLTLSILFWIPTHTLTFSIRFHDDYKAAGVPTFPSTYGIEFTRLVIAVSAVLAALCIGWASVLIGVQAGFLRLLVVLTTGLLLLSFATVMRPSEKVNFGLFKYASLYMLCSMIVFSIQPYLTIV
jgi:protoheme IX farnesyltransferase